MSAASDKDHGSGKFPGPDAPVSEVDRILKAANYFDLLSLPRERIAIAEVRKRYRRIALRCHPDKVQHPEAKAAFQKLSKAFDTLHDEVQQTIYFDKMKAAEAKAAKKARRKRQFNRPKTSAFSHNGMPRPGNKPKKRKQSQGSETGNKWYQRAKSWQEVEAELKRREEIEAKMRASFRRQKSRAYLERGLFSLLRRMRKTCHTLDERKGIAEHDLWPAEIIAESAARSGDASASGLHDDRSFLPPHIPPPLTFETASQKAKSLITYLRKEHDYTELEDEYHEIMQSLSAEPRPEQPKERVYDY